MRFDSASGTAVGDGRGCHALYASVEHTKAGCDDEGHAVVCYALNDIKGHLPFDCFVALRDTAAWERFMKRWRDQAEVDANDSDAFRQLRHE
jgi:hypothetical protein